MAAKKKTNHPAWALEHKKAGTELRMIRGRYYLYEYKTIYDRERKRPKKITGKLLGSINQRNGFVPSSKRKLEKTIDQKIFTQITCKEFGVSLLIQKQFALYCQSLEKIFGDLWKSIIAIAYCRFVYHCPLKNIPFRLAESFLPQMLGIGDFNEKRSSAVLKTIGENPEKRLAYMKLFIHKGEYMLIDATNVFSKSNHISLARKGYNKNKNYDSQFNLLYIYTTNCHMPVYYRLLPGNIREVKAFKNSLLEAGLQDAIIIADKGFYSKNNVTLLQKEKLNFILPLKRDNLLIQYEEIKQNIFKQHNLFFEHEKRIIWYNKYQADGLSLFLFLDENLRVREEDDYLKRISTHPESHAVEEYHLKRNTFGTISLLTGIKNISAIDTYQTYKSRMSIEVMFDAMKNIMEADHTYMQDEQTLQGWMFINHITLQWYQHLYIELKEKGLLKQISVNDYIQHLTDIKKIKINDQWYLNEFTLQTEKLLKKTGFALKEYNT